MQAQNGFKLPLQTVNGPQVAYAVQGEGGWVYIVSHDCLACDQTFSLV